VTAPQESPKDEMQRLIRKIAGRAAAGEKDEQLRARAARRMNWELAPHRQIGLRRARSYWYAEIDDIPSDHMDRARELALVLPIEEAINAVERAEHHLAHMRERLLDRLVGGGSSDPRDHPVDGPLGDFDRASRGPLDRHSGISGLARLPRIVG